MVYVTVCPSWKSVELVALCLLPFGGEGGDSEPTHLLGKRVCLTAPVIFGVPLSGFRQEQR